MSSWHLVRIPSSENFPDRSNCDTEGLTGQMLENYSDDSLAVPVKLENLEKNAFLWGICTG